MGKKQIEIEYRGPLTKAGFEALSEELGKTGDFKKTKKRLSLIYFRNKIPLKSSDLKDEKVDLRLRITEKKPEIVLKYGDWAGTDQRRAIIFPIDADQFEQAIDFLKYLGWTKCVIYATKTDIHYYKNIEISLVEITNFGYAYEAEILEEDDKSKIAKAKKEIEKACRELRLRQYREGEFEDQCDRINNSKQLKYDFEKDSSSIIRERYPSYF